MVHALKETHRVLKAGGGLIDLRPATSNRTVELELAAARLHIGEIDSSATFADHRAADAALDRFLRGGLLCVEHAEEFQLTTDLDTVEDLRAFAKTLRRSVLGDELVQRIESLIADEGDDYVIHTRRDMIIKRYRRTKGER